MREQGSVVPTSPRPGRPLRKAKGKSAPGRGSSGRRSRHIGASQLRPQSPPPGSGLASLPLEEQLLSARPSSPLPGASPRVGAHPGLIPARRPRGPEVKELPGGGAGSVPGCARTCALTVPRVDRRATPPGRHAGRGPGPRAPGKAAAPGGPAASVTSRGGASAALGARSRRRRTQRGSRAARSAPEAPMERYKGKGTGPCATHISFSPRAARVSRTRDGGGVAACASGPARTQVSRAACRCPALIGAEDPGPQLRRGQG